MRYIVTIETEKDGKKSIESSFSFQKLAVVNGQDITDQLDMTSLAPMVKDALMKEFELTMDRLLMKT